MSIIRKLFNVNQLLRNFYNNKILQHQTKLILRHRNEFWQKFKKNAELIYQSREQLDALINQRLRALLHHAKTNSPWYKITLANINIEKFTKDRIEELPTINKSILMEHWDNIVTNPRLSLAQVEKHLNRKSDKIDNLYLFNRYQVISTSGSSGKRGVFIYDWDEWITFQTSLFRYPYYNAQQTQLIWSKLGKNPKLVSLFVKNTAVLAYALQKTFWSESRVYFVPMSVTPLINVIERLNVIQPDIIMAAPSYIHKVCQLVQRGQISIEPKLLSLGGEPLFEQTEKLIKQTWPNVDIFNIFCCVEGIVGRSCKANSNELHLNEDLCIVEPLDAFNQHVQKGMMSSKVYLTNLYNYTLPLIRYENPDEILFMDKTCSCGISHQLFQAPKGRPGCDFNYPGNVFVHHSLFLPPLLLEKNIHEYLIEQTIDGVNIKIIANGYVDKQKLQESICNRLIKVGLINAQVTINEVSKINYLFSGKLNRFVPLDR